MTLYELVTQEVTARQAGQLYGLRFARSGRAFCPWHDDGKHPALGFYDEDRKCHCFVCGNGGNAIGLTAEILGISYYEAAKQLANDFHLSQDYEYRESPSTTAKAKVKKENEERQEIFKRWNYLCDVVHECDEILNRYTPNATDDRFTTILDVRSGAETELDYLWSEVLPRYERT